MGGHAAASASGRGRAAILARRALHNHARDAAAVRRRRRDLAATRQDITAHPVSRPVFTPCHTDKTHPVTLRCANRTAE